jgi:hypothetical protein
MERFIQTAGKALAKSRIGINHFLEHKIGGSRGNLILFILCLYVLFMLVLYTLLGFQPLKQSFAINLAMLIIVVCAVFWVAIFYESESHMHTDRHAFQMEPVKKGRIKYQLLDLEEYSQKQLERLISGKNVQHKINFTLENKSKDSANHRVLFTFFDELVLGGIKDLGGERKQEFFQLLMDSFLMNGEAVKPTTLTSSFSAWKADQEKLNSREQRQLVKKILGKE